MLRCRVCGKYYSISESIGDSLDTLPCYWLQLALNKDAAQNSHGNSAALFTLSFLDTVGLHRPNNRRNHPEHHAKLHGPAVAFNGFNIHSCGRYSLSHFQILPQHSQAFFGVRQVCFAWLLISIPSLWRLISNCTFAS